MDCDLSLDELIQRKKQEQQKSVQGGVAPGWKISLDDYIKIKKNKPKADPIRPGRKPKLPPPPKSLCEEKSDDEEEMKALDFFGLRKTPEYEKKVTGKLGGLSTCGVGRQYEDDAYKSLDEVVHERGILKPPRYSNSDKDDLPITGNRKRTGKKAVEFSVKSPTDGMNSTLEDVISKQEESDDVDISGQMKRKHESPANDNFVDGKRRKWSKRVITPHLAVGMLAEKGMIIELDIGRLADDNNRDKPHLWRCKVSCGDINAVCDSSRKVIAREMACKEFMKKLAIEYPNVRLPRYEVPDEVMIDPRVCRWLHDISTGEGIEMSHFVKPKENPQRKLSYEPFYSFVCTFSFGDEEVIVERDSIEHATLAAARIVYEKLTDGGSKFPVMTKYFHGSDCDPNVEYNFEESEVRHIMSVAEDEETTSKTLQKLRSSNIPQTAVITAPDLGDDLNDEDLDLLI